MAPKKDRKDVYQEVTDHIVAALETADPNKWHAPWHANAHSVDIPRNIASGKPYRGGNVVALWAEAMMRGYDVPTWGTYKQWKARGGQVRRGEHGTMILFWKKYERKVTKEDGTEEKTGALVARGYTVFNVAQVDGVEIVKPTPPPPVQRIGTADAFLTKLGARVQHGGDRAYYTPAFDTIQLPTIEDFDSPEDYYATSLHEHTHWTGHEARCARDLTGRFGTQSYAAEELVAELGAAFLCGTLGITNTPRADHAHYLKSWISLLKDDPKAIITAASKAQQAADWMHTRAGDVIEDEDEVEVETAVA